MKILALDLGTHCGWALWDGTRLESGVQVFDVRRGESPGMRFVRFNAWLDGCRALRPLELIVYEAAHHRGGAATEIAAGFSTRIHEFCAVHRLEHASCHTQSLKKFTTGKGNADKATMLAAVARRWKIVTDDNEGDAIALCYWALEEFVPARTARPA